MGELGDDYLTAVREVERLWKQMFLLDGIIRSRSGGKYGELGIMWHTLSVPAAAGLESHKKYLGIGNPFNLVTGENYIQPQADKSKEMAELAAYLDDKEVSI